MLCFLYSACLVDTYSLLVCTLPHRVYLIGGFPVKDLVTDNVNPLVNEKSIVPSIHSRLTFNVPNCN